MIELQNKKEPLYIQLYTQMANEIKEGIRQPGEKLPGRRTMASQLGISVHTVDHAYQLLASEGLTISKPKTGFIVQEVLSVPKPKQDLKNEKKKEENTYTFDLSTGSIDTSIFPTKTWIKIQRDLLYQHPELLQRGEMAGEYDLRQEIANYLFEYRGVVCTPEQIIIGAGSEVLLSLLAHILKGGVCAIENPGYHRTKAVLENNDIPCQLIDIDHHGMNISKLQKSKANLCYVTPSHHFPTGITMPATRRSQLLHWANQKEDRYIIEDDYDSEFRFDLKPLPSMQSMSDKVIYIKTFSKSLAPSIRIACMVLPIQLLDSFNKDFSVYSNTVSRFEQETLRTFIQNGQFARHIARMRHTYKKRQKQWIDSLQSYFKSTLTIHEEHTGLHVLLTYKNANSEADMVQKAQSVGIQVKGLSSYYHANKKLCPKNTVIAGFSNLNPEHMNEVARLLYFAWSNKDMSASSSTT